MKICAFANQIAGAGVVLNGSPNDALGSGKLCEFPQRHKF